MDKIKGFKPVATRCTEAKPLQLQVHRAVGSANIVEMGFNPFKLKDSNNLNTVFITLKLI